MNTIVDFTEVGRGKRSWSTTFPGAMCEGMVEEIWKDVRRKGGLLSRGMDVDYDPTNNVGTVYVGGFRPVGSFTVRAATAENATNDV